MKDILGHDIAVGDIVAIAVTSYRSGKLTLARVESLQDLGEGTYGGGGKVHVKTEPGKRRTASWADQVLVVEDWPEGQVP